MTKIITLAIVLLCGVRAEAQIVGTPVAVTLHDAPQGVTSCLVPDVFTPHTIGTGLCPALSFQVHWKPGTGTPVIDPPNTLVSDLAHTHIECNLPHLGELPGPVTVPCRFVLFHAAGRITLAQGQLVSAWSFDDPLVTFPLVGDPLAVRTWPFHLTWNPAQEVLGDNGRPIEIVQPHGWFNLTFMCRTVYDDGDQVDTKIAWTGWSVRDPSVAPIAEGEGSRVILAALASAMAPRAIGQWAFFGSHLMEFRSASIPLYAPFRVPIQYVDFSYSYTMDSHLQLLHTGVYTNLFDNDFHAGIAGTAVDTVPTPVSNGFGTENLVTLDPVAIDTFTAPAGLPPHTHRNTTSWQASTDPLIDTPGDVTVLPHGETLVSLVSFDVAIGPNPVGCTPATCPTGTAPPVVVVPPTCMPPAVLTNGQCVTPALPPPPPPVPTIVSVTTCQATTLSTGAVSTKCVHEP